MDPRGIILRSLEKMTVSLGFLFFFFHYKRKTVLLTLKTIISMEASYQLINEWVCIWHYSEGCGWGE